MSARPSPPPIAPASKADSISKAAPCGRAATVTGGWPRSLVGGGTAVPGRRPRRVRRVCSPPPRPPAPSSRVREREIPQWRALLATGGRTPPWRGTRLALPPPPVARPVTVTPRDGKTVHTRGAATLRGRVMKAPPIPCGLGSWPELGGGEAVYAMGEAQKERRLGVSKAERSQGPPRLPEIPNVRTAFAIEGGGGWVAERPFSYASRPPTQAGGLRSAGAHTTTSLLFIQQLVEILSRMHASAMTTHAPTHPGEAISRLARTLHLTVVQVRQSVSR